MKEDKYLWVAVAVVLCVIGVEYLIARRKGKILFRFENTISNFLMGVFDRIAGIFMIPLIYIYYQFLYDNFAFFNIPKTIAWFVLAVILSDFIWYFYHKSGHRINLFWGAHIVHHQSEDYNYSVALNLTPFQVFVRVIFWSLMPVLGYTPEVVLGTHLVIGTYQFLLHTTLIPKLGIIELFFVTPSHHRVHHGSNEIYLDKNYGGVLIIWDRIFGTFQEEEQEVVYGITKDINSRDFLVSVFHYYKNLIFQMKQLPALKDKLLLLVSGPDWVPVSGPLELMPLYVDKGTYKYHNFSSAKKIYILFNTVLALVTMLLFAYNMSSFNGIDMVAIGSFIFLTLVITGKYLEQKSTLIWEIVRLLLFVVQLIYIFAYK